MVMEMVADSGLLRALDLVEVNPILDDRNTTADPRRRAGDVGARAEDHLVQGIARIQAHRARIAGALGGSSRFLERASV